MSHLSTRKHSNVPAVGPLRLPSPPCPPADLVSGPVDAPKAQPGPASAPIGGRGLAASDSWPLLCDAAPTRHKQLDHSIARMAMSPDRPTVRDIVMSKTASITSGSAASHELEPAANSAGGAADTFTLLAHSSAAGSDSAALDARAAGDGASDGEDADAGDNGCNSDDAVVDPSLWKPNFAMHCAVEHAPPTSASPSECDPFGAALPRGLLDDDDDSVGDLSPSRHSCAAGWTDSLSAPSPTMNDAAAQCDGAVSSPRSARVAGTAAAELSAPLRTVSNSAPLTGTGMLSEEQMHAMFSTVLGNTAATGGHGLTAHASGGSMHSSAHESPLYATLPQIATSGELSAAAAAVAKGTSMSDEDLLQAINTQLRAMQRSSSLQYASQAPAPVPIASHSPAPSAAQNIPMNELLIRKVALLQQVCAQQAQKQSHYGDASAHHSMQTMQPAHAYQQHTRQPRTTETPPPRDLQLLQQLLLQQVAQQQTTQPRKAATPPQQFVQQYGHRASYAPQQNQRTFAPPAARASTAATHYGASSQYNPSYAHHRAYGAAQQTTAPMYASAARPARRSAQYDRHSTLPMHYPQGASAYRDVGYGATTATHGYPHGSAALTAGASASVSAGLPYQSHAAPSAQQVEHDAARAALQAKVAAMSLTQRAAPRASNAEYFAHDQAAQWGVQQSQYPSMSRY